MLGVKRVPMAATVLVVASIVLLLPHLASISVDPMSYTARLPPLRGDMHKCKEGNCMKEFDSCWTDGFHEFCPQQYLYLLRSDRHRNPCFNQVFWHCLAEFATRDGVDLRYLLNKMPPQPPPLPPPPPPPSPKPPPPLPPPPEESS